MNWSGGCLCGAVRYQSKAEPKYASYCHCGMCRKASGAPFTGFVEFPEGAFQWVGKEPAIYVSSEGVIRRFCNTCGGQLTFEANGVMFLTIGSLDHPEQVDFHCHTYTKTRLPGMAFQDGLPQFPGPAGGNGGRPG